MPVMSLPPGERSSVLVVDDNEAVSLALTLLLGSIGWDAEEASSASQALAKLKEHRYKLAFIDIRMPDIDGIELCRLIHEQAGDDAPTVIILSGYIDAPHHAAALTAGARAILEKPIGRTELIDFFEKQGFPYKSEV